MTWHNTRSSVSLLGATHFLVDFVCGLFLTFAVLSHHLSAWEITVLMLLYNGFAFAFQFPVGALADLLRVGRSMTVIGCLLVAVGILLPYPQIMGCVIGLGNACFHIGGGREALQRGGNRASAVGRFVAPGAIGIFVGPRLAPLMTNSATRTLGAILSYGAVILLLLCATALFLTRPVSPKTEKNTIAPLPLSNSRRLLVILCMAVTVFLRSYMGTITTYFFQQLALTATFFVLCVFFGKWCGGILADRFGAFRFTLIAQTLGTLLFVVSVWFPYAAFPAVLLFNTTMAITAHTLYRCLPHYSGTMFGVTTLAIFLGLIPGILRLPTPFFNAPGLLLLGTVSTAVLLIGLHLAKEESSYD